MRLRDGDCGGQLKSGVCAGERQRRLSFHGCLHHTSPCPPFLVFLFKKTHNMNSSLFFSDYIIPAARDHKTKPHYFEDEDECKMLQSYSVNK